MALPTKATRAAVWGPALTMALSAVSTPAAAQYDVTVQATGTLTTGYDTNVNSVGQDDPNTGGPVEAFTVQPAPGLALFVDTARFRFGITGAYTFLFYPGNSEFDTSGQAVQAGLDYALSPTESLTMSAGWSRFTTNTVTLQGSAATAVQAQPAGDTTLNTVTVGEAYTKEVSPFFQVVQSAETSFSAPEDGDAQPPFLNVGGTIGPEAVLGNHALAALPSVTWSKPFNPDDDAETAGFAVQEQVIASLSGRWRWDWMQEWSSELSAGLTSTVTIGQGAAFAPVGSAAIYFTRDNYNASLSYQRSVTPDIITGQVFTTDSWSVNGAIPIWSPYNLGIQTSTGFSLNQVVSETDDQTAAIDTGLVKTFVVDASVGWTPPQYPAIQVRYQHFSQFGASPDQVVLPNYDRDVISLVLSYAYPPANVGLPGGQPRRVDKGDRDKLLYGEEKKKPPTN